MARPRASGALPGGLAEVHGAKPAARHARPGLLSPLRERLQPAIPRLPGCHSFARSLSRRPCQRKRLAGAGHAVDGQARAGRWRRSRRAVVRLSLAADGPRRRHPRCRSRARRNDALRDPAIPAPARRTDAGDRAHPGDGRDDRLQLPRQRRARREGRRALRRRIPRDRRAGRWDVSSASSAPATPRSTRRGSRGAWVPRKRY